jgi:manganese-dependent inorganic pyrophosphatase
MARLVDINTFQKQKVILVDHNQPSQSVDGLEESEIVEIIDHHNLSTLMTSTPINFRISPVGCTCTLLYKIYNESHVEIPKNIAGIMLSAIISDTLLFKSPTTTKEDIEVAKALANIAKLDVYEYGRKMFEASTSVANMSVEEIIHSDMKTFKFDKINMVIGQTNTMDFKEISKKEKEFVSSLNSICKIGNANIALLFVTDIIKNGSYIYYNEDSKSLLEEAYGIDNIEQGHYIEGVVSRKKQMLPPLIEVIERR